MTHPTWLEPALNLQNCDVEIRALTQRIAQIPVEIAKFKAESDEMNANFQATRHNLQNLEVRLKDLELEAEKQVQSIQDLLTKSAMVKKQEDYNAALTQIETCKQRKSDLETEEIILLDEIEAAQKAVRIADAENTERQQEIKEEIADLEQILKDAEAAKTAKIAQREVLREKVPNTILPLYERMWARNRGVPLNKVIEGVCQSCHTRVTAQVLNDLQKVDEIVTCSNCSAVLYT